MKYKLSIFSCNNLKSMWFIVFFVVQVCVTIPITISILNFYSDRGPSHSQYTYYKLFFRFLLNPWLLNYILLIVFPIPNINFASHFCLFLETKLISTWMQFVSFGSEPNPHKCTWATLVKEHEDDRSESYTGNSVSFRPFFFRFNSPFSLFVIHPKDDESTIKRKVEHKQQK